MGVNHPVGLLRPMFPEEFFGVPKQRRGVKEVRGWWARADTAGKPVEGVEYRREADGSLRKKFHAAYGGKELKKFRKERAREARKVERDKVGNLEGWKAGKGGGEQGLGTEVTESTEEGV